MLIITHCRWPSGAPTYYKTRICALSWSVTKMLRCTVSKTSKAVLDQSLMLSLHRVVILNSDMSVQRSLIWTFPFTPDFPWRLFDVGWILHFFPLVLHVVPVWSLTMLGSEHRGRRVRFSDSNFVGTKFIPWNLAWLSWPKLASGFPRAERCFHLSHRSLPQLIVD